MLALSLWSALSVYGLYVLVSSDGGCYLSDLAQLPAEIVIHVTQEAEAATQDCDGNSPTSFLIRVSGVSWSGDKEITEDWRICNAVVIAEIISHNNDCSQMIVALHLLSRSVHLRNMALFCPVPHSNAPHAVRRLISWNKVEDRHTSNVLSQFLAG